MATDRPSLLFGLEWWVIVVAVWLVALSLLLAVAILVRGLPRRHASWVGCAAGFAIIIWSFRNFGQPPQVNGIDCAYALSDGTLGSGGACGDAAIRHLVLTVGAPAMVVAAAACGLALAMVARGARVKAPPAPLARTG